MLTRHKERAMKLYVDRRKGKGGDYFTFSYTDPETRKRVRLPRSQTPRFTDYDEAKEWAQAQDAFAASRKKIHKQRVEYRNKYYDFTGLVEDYTKYQKRRAKNSWENNVMLLNDYVLPYFLDTHKASNVNDWITLFPKFKDWLDSDVRSNLSGQPLAVSTKNHIIQTLNTFMRYLSEYNLLDSASYKVCPLFPEHERVQKSVESIYSEVEFLTIYNSLLKINAETAEFFYVLRHTGLRFGELQALPLSSLFRGTMDTTLDGELHNTGMGDYVGYIVVESQFKDKTLKRDDTGDIERKPLKGKKRIAAKYSRTIPIWDKTTWNLLAKRYMAQEKLYRKKVYGSNKDNYVFFDDLKLGASQRALNKAFLQTGLERKTFHDLRHTFATEFIGRSKNFFLAKTLLGHSSLKVLERYNHIFEQMNLASKASEQIIELID